MRFSVCAYFVLTKRIRWNTILNMTGFGKIKRPIEELDLAVFLDGPGIGGARVVQGRALHPVSLGVQIPGAPPFLMVAEYLA